MEDNEWQTVAPKKKERVRRVVVDEAGNTIDKALAHKMQRDLDITGFADALFRLEVTNMTLDGWRYVKVLKGTDTDKRPADTDTNEYIEFDILNKWGDRLLFTRTRSV